MIKVQKEDFVKENEKIQSLAHQYNLKNMTLIEENQKLQKDFESIKHLPLEFETLTKAMAKVQESVTQKDFQLEDFKVKIQGHLAQINELKQKEEKIKIKRKKLAEALKETSSENTILKSQIEKYKIKEQQAIEIHSKFTKVTTEYSQIKNELIQKERKILEVEKARETNINEKNKEIKILKIMNYEQNSMLEEELIYIIMKFEEKIKKISSLDEELTSKNTEIISLYQKIEDYEAISQKLEYAEVENLRIGKELISSRQEN